MNIKLYCSHETLLPYGGVDWIHFGHIEFLLILPDDGFASFFGQELVRHVGGGVGDWGLSSLVLQNNLSVFL